MMALALESSFVFQVIAVAENGRVRISLEEAAKVRIARCSKQFASL
jgi:hypothetical protein